MLVASAPPALAHDILQPRGDADQTRRLQAAIDEAAGGSGEVVLGAGTYNTDTVRITRPITISGVPGQTVLAAQSGPVLNIESDNVTLRGVGFRSAGLANNLVEARSCKNLGVSACIFSGGQTALKATNCGGWIESNSFSGQTDSAIFSTDAAGLLIDGNAIDDIGNNGIQVWRSERGEDGTIISGNRVSRIRADNGGDGPYGNGIVVFRAGNVTVSSNRVSDTRFSGIRCNSGSNVSITGNSISRSGEVAIYVEFAYQGAIVASNIIEDVVFGISITNFNDDGRLTVCDGNLIRKSRGTGVLRSGGGIHMEADTIASNNLIEDIQGWGIQMGWGGRNRNQSAVGNTLRNCTVAIAPSVVAGSGKMLIANNIIDGSATAIQGFDYETAATKELASPGAELPAHITLDNNIVM
jgi:uncharacterized secreted repeat protein (TIGR03808 family)